MKLHLKAKEKSSSSLQALEDNLKKQKLSEQCN
jgi:hypothetical protein